VTWREAFKSQVREAIAEAYDEAHACALGFSAGALGFARVVVERDFTPLRWVIRDGGGEVVLVDSKGDPNTKVTVFDAQSPDVGGEVDREAAAIGLRVPSNGALFSASSGSTTATVVAVPKQRITSLANLAQRPSVQNCRKDAASLERLVHIAAGWERARLGATSITSQRRDAAVNALQACIIGTIAGDRWARAEAEFEQNGDRVRSVEALRALVANRPDEKGVVAVLSLRAAELARSAPSELEAIFVRAVSTFIAATDAPQLAPFALRLATSPSAAVRWTTSGAALQRHDDNVEQLQRVETQLSLRDALGRLLAIPVILRAARLAVALVAGPSMEKLEAGLSKDIRWTNSPMSWD
jgi:hypothetical protein